MIMLSKKFTSEPAPSPSLALTTVARSHADGYRPQNFLVPCLNPIAELLAQAGSLDSETLIQEAHRYLMQAEGVIASVGIYMCYHYQRTGQIDGFQGRQLKLWCARREQLYAMHTLLVQRTEFEIRTATHSPTQLSSSWQGYILQADQPEAYQVASSPPSYSECVICA